MTNNKINKIVKVGVLAAIAFVLQVIGSMLGLKVAGFLEIEISDLPAIIGTLAMGPLAGVLIELIKNALHCTLTSTGFVGELANFLVNGTFVLVLGLLYKYHKTKKGALIGFLCAILAMCVMGIFSNLYILLPLYMPQAPLDVKMQLVLSIITPFNFVKGLVLALITLLIYKKISPLLK